MKKFTNEDKLWHFAAGAGVVAVARYLGDGNPTAIKLGVAACLIIAISKELWDANRAQHSADGADFVATVVGGLTVAVMLL